MMLTECGSVDDQDTDIVPQCRIVGIIGAVSRVPCREFRRRVRAADDIVDCNAPACRESKVAVLLEARKDISIVDAQP